MAVIVHEDRHHIKNNIVDFVVYTSSKTIIFVHSCMAWLVVDFHMKVQSGRFIKEAYVWFYKNYYIWNDKNW